MFSVSLCLVDMLECLLNSVKTEVFFCNLLFCEMSYSYVLGRNISHSIKRHKQSVKTPDMTTHTQFYANEPL